MGSSDTPITEDLQCPLCQYNLRGLWSNRCPECGHDVDLDALREHHANTLPHFFEHQTGTGWKAFRKTLRTSLRPSGPWKFVKPVNWLGRRRMIAYKLIQVFPLAAGMAVVLLLSMAWLIAHTEHQRRLYYNDMRLQMPADQAMQWINTRVPRQSIGVIRDNAISHVAWMKEPLSILLISLFAWPWMLFVSQLFFLRSFKAGNIRAGHLLRCAIYSSDIALLWPVAFTVAFIISSLDYFTQSDFGWYSRSDPTIDGVRYGLLILWILLTLRLITSYRSYLQIPHAMLGAVCASALSACTILAILLPFYRFFWKHLGLL